MKATIGLWLLVLLVSGCQVASPATLVATADTISSTPTEVSTATPPPTEVVASRTPLPTAAETPSVPTILAWSARPAVESLLISHQVTQITVHHDGAYLGDADPLARLASIQNWHIDGQGWGDIAYHFLLDRDGNIYQGRLPDFQGDTGTEYDPEGHLLVTLMGDYNVEDPTEKQLDSLVSLLRYLLYQYQLDEQTISTHRDQAATDCPGIKLYAYFQSGYIADAVK